MTTGVQFTGNLGPNASQSWFTHSWAAGSHVIWYVVPTSPRSGAPQLEWTVSVERPNATQCTYWITVKNLTAAAVTFEARYAIMP